MMPHSFRQSHGNLRSTFEGDDDSLPKTLGVAVSLLGVLITGVWLILHGLT